MGLWIQPGNQAAIITVEILGPKEARQVRSNVKVTVAIFSDFSGVVHHEYEAQAQNIAKQH